MLYGRRPVAVRPVVVAIDIDLTARERENERVVAEYMADIRCVYLSHAHCFSLRRMAKVFCCASHSEQR